MIQNFFSSSAAESSPWRELSREADWADLREASHRRPQVVLKHSPRCGSSAMAKFQLERAWPEPPASFDLMLIDVIRDRPLSNLLARELEVVHHSPQVLILWRGELVFHTSHHRITPEAIEAALVESGFQA